MVDDAEAQEYELLALESIFEGDKDTMTFRTVKEGDFEYKSGTIQACPNLNNPPIEFSCNYKPSGDFDEKNVVHEIFYLPPINLNFVLPCDYPSKNPPQITLTCTWLNRNQLSAVCKKLDEIWADQEGQEILFIWVQFLQDDLFNFLDLGNKVTIAQEEFVENQNKENLDVRVMQDAGRFSDILPLVLEYDELKRKRVFENTPFECNVCFSEKYGKDCMRFKDCGHVYCTNCIKSYFDLQIKEGNMKALSCPEPNCESQAYPAQVKSLVSAKDFDRYETLLLQTTLDTMKDVVYCPRKFCQSAVVVEPEETIGICSVCNFSFCPFCKLAYHGVEPCKLKKAKVLEMCEKYKNADTQTKKELESKYGAKVLQQTLQNLESEQWIMDNSKNCPGCGAAVEKKDGCNKMTCYKCKCYFCWLCMRRLSLANPYDHYNTSKSKCFNKLFHGVTFEEMDDEDWWF